MTDEIPPALTADEWAEIRTHPLPWGPSELIGEYASEGEYAKALALANAALPDGDLRKITREDVVKLRSIAADMRAERPADTWADDADVLEALAAKLAAILPPREGV